MGRNDARSVVTLCSFRAFFIICFIIFTGLSYSLNAQFSDDIPKYNISLRYPLSILHKYKYEETTEVLRTFSDSSKRSYKRNVQYFFTQ